MIQMSEINPYNIYLRLKNNIGKNSPAQVQPIVFSPLPHSLDRKDSPTAAALVAGASYYFVPFLIQPHPLILLIMVRTKKPSLETFFCNIRNLKNDTTFIVYIHS